MTAGILNVLLKGLSELSELSEEGEKLINSKQVYKKLDLDRVMRNAEMLKASLAHARSLKAKA